MFPKKSVFLILLFISFSLFAQQPFYRHYTVNDGLASSTVYKIIQDKKGFIWIATENGAQRFDGKTFETFSKENGLLDNTILDLFEDSKGRIWFLSLSGQVAYYDNGNIHTTANDSILKQVDAKSNLTYFTEDKRGTVYISSMWNGVYKIQDGKVNKFNIKEVKYLWHESDSLIYIGQTGGVFMINKNSEIEILYKGSVVNSLDRILKISDDTLLYSNWDKCDLLIKNRNGFFLANNEFVNTPKIHSLIKSEKPGYAWLATIFGAYLFNSFKNNIEKKYLENKVVNSVLEDSEKNIWFGTFGEGIYFLNNRSIYSFQDNKDSNANGLNDILNDRQGKLWLGYNNGRVKYIQNGNLFNYNSPNLPDFWNRVNKIILDNKKYILVSTETRFFNINPSLKWGFVFEGERINNSFKVITSSSNYDFWGGGAGNLNTKYQGVEIVFQSNRIGSLLEDQQGNVWVGGTDALKKYEKSELKNQIEYLVRLFKKTKKSCILNDKYLKVNVRINKELNYVYVTDFQDNFTDYSLYHKSMKSQINDIEESPDHTIWTATHGAGIFSVKNDTIIKQYKLSDGLSSLLCKVIKIENDSLLWIGTNKGLNKLTFSNNKLNVDVFNSANGLISDDVNAIEFQGDTVWVATSGGLSYFNKKNISKSLTPPPVYITKIQISNSDTTLLDYYNLEFSQNSLNLKFIGLAYQLPEKVSYKYKLDGVQSDWIYTSDNSIKYDYLPAGDYTFQVYAKSPDGVWSSNPATVSFHISPPYYQTWWFYSIIAATLLIITGLVFYLRGKQIERRTRKDAETELKLLERELKALRAQMNPHFMFNALNSIQYLIINSEPKTSVKYLSKFSKLMRKVLDHSRHTSIPVSDELDALKLYLEIESLRFSNGFSYTITVDENIDPSYIEIPPMVLQPYVENSIIHGISPKNSGGRIDISIYLENDFLVCSVDDNGVGRNSEINRKSDSDHKSVGMSVTQRRLEGMTELMKIKGRVEIIDKHDSDGIQTGTTVKIFIPKEMVL